MLTKGKPSIYSILVPEHVVRESASFFGDEENTFKNLLEIADQYRDADMNPIFLWDIKQNALFCVAEETFQKKLN